MKKSTTQEIKKDPQSDVITVEDLRTDKFYDKVYKHFYDLVLEDYEIRKKIVTVVLNKKKKLSWKVSNLLVNMIFWKPYLKFNKIITEELIFDCSTIDSDSISRYLDMIIRDFKNELDINDLNFEISEIIFHLGNFSLDFNMIIGNTINLKDKIDLANRNKEYDDLIHTQLDENMTFNEIENELNRKTHRLIEILKEEDNCFRDYLRSKEGVHFNQLTQFEIAIGPKPDLEGNIYPHIINSNFLVNGLRNAADYYIDSCGGRKASIMNHTQVKDSGYMTRKLTLLCIDTLLDPDTTDCGAKNLMKINIDCEKTLTRLNDRYCVFNPEDKEGFFLIDENDKSLIGKDVYLRSPVTCVSKKGICRTCYGGLWKINKNIHIGIFGVTTLTSQLTQQMLSAKHLLKTDSEIITWPENFLKCFTLSGNLLYLNPSLLKIDPETKIIFKLREELEHHSLMNKRGFTHLLGIEFPGSKKNKSFKIEKKLYLSKYLEKFIRGMNIIGNKYLIEGTEDCYKMSVKDLLTVPIFSIEVSNREISKPLSMITELIESKTHLNITTKEEFFQTFIKLLNEGKIHVNSVHIELIIRQLLRDPVNTFERPDFTTEDPPYKIVRVAESILNSKSLINSLSFEKIKHQLFNWKTYKYKTENSMLDYLFYCDPFTYSDESEEMKNDQCSSEI